MYSIEEVKVNAVVELISWDQDITTENVIHIVTSWVKNLASYLLESDLPGVIDCTGMTDEEKDCQYLEHISDYIRCRDQNRENDITDWSQVIKQAQSICA